MSLHGVYLPDYKNTFGGDPLSNEQIKEIFKSVNFPVAVQIITKFNVALWHLFPDPKVQAFLLNQTFNRTNKKLVLKEVKRKLEERAKTVTGEGFIVIFHRHQLLYALKLLLLAGTSGNSLNEEATWKSIGKPLIAISSYLEPDEDTTSLPISERIEHMRKFMLRSAFLAHTANDHGILSMDRIARTVHLWTDIYNKLRNEGKLNFDFEADFLEASGMTFIEFIGLGFSSYIQTKYLDPINDSEDKYIFNLNNYFSKTKIDRTKAQAIFSQLTFKAADFPELYAEDVRNILKDSDVFNYNFITFQRKPLIELFDGVYFVVDVGFFSQRVRDGIYWILENYYLTNGMEAQRRELSALKGYMTESYSSEIIEETFKTYIRLPEDSRKQADYLIEIKKGEDSYLIILEIKHLTLSYKTLVSGDKYTSLKDFDKIFGKKGLGQVFNTISRIINKEDEFKHIDLSKVKKIMPVTVSSDFIPDDPFSTLFYEENFIKQHLVNVDKNYHSLIANAMNINLDEFEVLQASIQEKGESVFLDFLLERDKAISTRNEINLYKMEVDTVWNTLIKKGLVGKNTKLTKIFDEFAKSLKKSLFSG